MPRLISGALRPTLAGIFPVRGESPFYLPIGDQKFLNFFISMQIKVCKEWPICLRKSQLLHS